MKVPAASYSLDQSAIREPPATAGGMFRYLGPSMILTASVVGSGELVMTTTLGARAGFVCLWVILVSCLLKVTVQLEFGKHAISTGETSLEAFNKLPGPRWRGASWVIWIWFGIKAGQLIQYGGIIGGVALALNLALPFVDVWIWTCIAGLSTAALVYHGHYRFIERGAMLLAALFSLFTIFCVVLLQGTPYRIGLADLAQGFSFQLPAAAIGVAVAAFGATGVSADEIISYPYWCLEKGYARWTGARDASAEWTRRAQGWIRVMYLDAVVSMVVYTIATMAFYILGAAILHGRGEVPAGYDMIRVLSRIYTESFGPGAMVIFLTGSVIVLFSTLFASCAASTRMFSDAFAQFGVLDFRDPEQRTKWIGAIAWILPSIWVVMFLIAKAPVAMIIAGAIAVATLLIFVVFAAWNFRYRRLDSRLRPGWFYDVMLWLSFLAITGVGIKVVAGVFE